MFAYEGLEVYEKAKLFNKKLRTHLRELSGDPYILDQLNRASFSILLNIAEGSGRITPRDQAHFFVIARGSTFECSSILDYVKGETGIEEKYIRIYYNDLEEISKMLFALIKNNRSRKNTSQFFKSS